jgi:RNA polymerase sigma-70 factor (sigma-E family)
MAVVTERRAGDRVSSDGFEAFYRRERPGLHRALTLTLGDADLALDAVDEGMARAYQRWRTVQGYANPAGWVYRVARNWAISRLRRRRRSTSVPEVPDHRTHEDARRDEALAAALAALPESQRAVVVLRYHLDWSVEQTATALGVAPGTVKSRLHRALAELRTALEATR